jgi:very-short-patch-repair endonuclease
VLTVESAVRILGRPAVRWRLASARWQRAADGVLVTQSGPLTEQQRLWVAVLAAGDGAVLAGLTAARLDGLTGFDETRTYLLLPASRRVRKALPGVVVHRTRLLGPADVHPARLPPRTRIARSVVDAAAWAATDRRAMAILAAGVQQRLIKTAELSGVVGRCRRVPRRALMRTTLADVAGGAEALSELDFCRLVRRYRLPEPDRQVRRVDGQGYRWLDAFWDWARLVVEIDGRWHMDVRTWWADMRRDNALTVDGYRVLRFPAFAVRESPDVVAGQIASALRQAHEAGLAPG